MPAEPRDRVDVDAAALARLVDDAEHAADPPHAGREHEHDREREEEPPQHLGVVPEALEHADTYSAVRTSPSATGASTPQ